MINGLQSPPKEARKAGDTFIVTMAAPGWRLLIKTQQEGSSRQLLEGTKIISARMSERNSLPSGKLANGNITLSGQVQEPPPPPPPPRFGFCVMEPL